MPPSFRVRVLLRAELSPSEDREKLLAAMTAVLGGTKGRAEQRGTTITVEHGSPECLYAMQDQLRDRQVRGAARRRLVAGASRGRTTVMVNRQAAAAGVIALCDAAEESPLGPIYLTIESRDLDDVIEWLAGPPPG